jgi:hypothetical protein
MEMGGSDINQACGGKTMNKHGSEKQGRAARPQSTQPTVGSAKVGREAEVKAAADPSTAILDEFARRVIDACRMRDGSLDLVYNRETAEILDLSTVFGLSLRQRYHPYLHADEGLRSRIVKRYVARFFGAMSGACGRCNPCCNCWDCNLSRCEKCDTCNGVDPKYPCPCRPGGCMKLFVEQVEAEDDDAVKRGEAEIEQARLCEEALWLERQESRDGLSDDDNLRRTVSDTGTTTITPKAPLGAAAPKSCSEEAMT